MIHSQINIRYAKAFYQTLSVEKKLDVVVADMQLLSRFFSQRSSRIFFEKNANMQKNLLNFWEQSLKSHVNESTDKFFRFLSAKHRVAHLPNIVQAFLTHHRWCLGEVEVKLVSAYPPKEALLEKIQKKIEQKINKKCHLTVKTDKNLIGGFCVYFKDLLWDYSLRGQLQKIEKILTQ